MVLVGSMEVISSAKSNQVWGNGPVVTVMPVLLLNRQNGEELLILNRFLFKRGDVSRIRILPKAPALFKRGASPSSNYLGSKIHWIPALRGNDGPSSVPVTT